MTTVRVIGAVASKSGITIYLEDGTPKELKKDSYKTNEIMQDLAKPLTRRQVVELDLSKYDPFATVERKSGGFIRFTIEKAKNFLGLSPITGGSIGVTSLADDETLVANVGGKEIPGAQSLAMQVSRAAYGKNYKGFEIFMKRLSDEIENRGHTVQELLRFMEKADLPIAEDGSIIAYKTLRKTTEEGVFVDCHSRKVRQKLGSRVSMPMKDVDDSRRTQCSTGLHIARRTYLRWFSGDVIVLVKIDPCDVIAVPLGEPDKMRVMAYHIVALLSQEADKHIRSQSMEQNDEVAKTLADIIVGDHIGVTEEVRIGELKKDAESEYDKEIDVEEKEDIEPFLGAGNNGMAAALTDDSDGGSVDLKALNEKITEAKEESQEKPKRKKTANPTRKPAKALTEAQKKREKAYKAVMKGMSQREAAKTFNVCAKTLRKMIKDRSE